MPGNPTIHHINAWRDFAASLISAFPDWKMRSMSPTVTQ
ncbi:hypothetical protein GLE_5511 [Lysobacter enzymogenes]|uniref:Uncharacterized protein n=1 Tax=Lysobacter enzymogenes TaxID=69 RepID=A0A0S2DQG3_LYSEN|nr:hypothetical protein GLE_5511 [Lysobacter enzymogenes]